MYEAETLNPHPPQIVGGGGREAFNPRLFPMIRIYRRTRRIYSPTLRHRFAVRFSHEAASLS